ncbi:MAG: O-antigen ligase family protein [Oscillibacter sp.]
MPIFLALVAGFSVFLQGGYYPAFFLWAGALLGLAFFVPGRQFYCTRGLMLPAALALWYPLASLVNGASARSLGQAMLPLCCLLFAGLCVSLSEAERKQLLVWLRRLSGVVAVFAILAFFDILPIAGAVTAHRLQFTFQYVNAAGIWFAGTALLRREAPDRFSDWLYPFVLIALLLTRSIGALGLFVLFQLYVLWKGRKSLGDPHFWVPSLVLILGSAAAVATRFQQGLGTFAERLVQSHDGLLGMLSAPIFGYGAGRWPDVKPLFETYSYRAIVVHNSYVQAGVEAGFPALLLLAAAVVLALWLLRRQSPSLKAAAAVIALHAVMDFSLCFFAVDCLFLSVLALPHPPHCSPLPRWAARAFGGVSAFILVALAVWRLAV